MQGKYSAASVVVMVLCLSACTTTHVFRVEPPENIGQRERAKAESYFGAVSEETKIDCNGSGLSEIYVSQSFFRSLLSTLTLGAYQDTRIRYFCHAGPNPGAGDGFAAAPESNERIAPDAGSGGRSDGQ